MQYSILQLFVTLAFEWYGGGEKFSGSRHGAGWGKLWKPVGLRPGPGCQSPPRPHQLLTHPLIIIQLWNNTFYRLQYSLEIAFWGALVRSVFCSDRKLLLDQPNCFSSLVFLPDFLCDSNLSNSLDLLRRLIVPIRTNTPYPGKAQKKRKDSCCAEECQCHVKGLVGVRH